MVFVSRKIAFPIFVIGFAIIFSMVIFNIVISDDLEVSESSFEFGGESIIIKMEITNTSNHTIRGATVEIIYDEKEKKDLIPNLEPGATYVYEARVEISDSLLYDIYVKAPFSRTKYYPIELSEETIRPVKAKVTISSEMTVGKEYPILITLSNVSESDLSDVTWITSTEGDFFSESFFPIKFSLKAGESENFPLTLTPTTPGIVKVKFILRVNKIDTIQEYTITVFPE